MRLATESCRGMEDVRDPVREPAQIHIRHVGHNRRNPGLLQPDPVAFIAAARQPEDFVPGGQSTSDGETDPPCCPGHEHPPARWLRRWDSGHAPA